MRRRLVQILTQPASVADPWGVAEAWAAFLLEQDPLALAAPRARAQMVTKRSEGAEYNMAKVAHYRFAAQSFRQSIVEPAITSEVRSRG
jgi:hypothetical protein